MADEDEQPTTSTYCINVFEVLARREITPSGGRRARRKCFANPSERGCYQEIDPRTSLYSWVEAKSLGYVFASRYDDKPPTTSTTAFAISPDGGTIASVRTDCTIWIIDYESKTCKRILRGHDHHPSMVAFHPSRIGMLASGGWDKQVRLWSVNTAECTGMHIFDHEISGIAFHPLEEFLAIAAGQEIYIWTYRQAGSTPAVVLRSNTSFLSVHFQPHAAPLLFATECNDVDRSPFSDPLETSTCPRRQSSNDPLFQKDVEETLSLTLQQHRLLFPEIQSWWMARSPAVCDPRAFGSYYLHCEGIPDSSIAIVCHNELLQYGTIQDFGRHGFHLPLTSRLRIWPYDARTPCKPIHADTCRLTISHVVTVRYGSEVVVDLSSCGRFLVACIACTLPDDQAGCSCADDGEQLVKGNMYTVTVTGDRVIYELRVYSIEQATFGLLLVSKQIDAASSLASIQFSPTSDHILLAFFKSHWSLKTNSSFVDEHDEIYLFSTIEAYRVRDMKRIPVALSDIDSIRFASFHPRAGHGIVYGTLLGRLGFIRRDQWDMENRVCFAIGEIQDIL